MLTSICIEVIILITKYRRRYTMKRHNTGKVLGVRWDRYNWKFERTIWQDENGVKFVVVNNTKFYLGEVIAQCDDYYII